MNYSPQVVFDEIRFTDLVFYTNICLKLRNIISYDLMGGITICDWSLILLEVHQSSKNLIILMKTTTLFRFFMIHLTD